MCLAVPGKVIEISGSNARVDIEGVVRDANISLLPGVKVGDYVIVHAGFAMEKYNKEDAKETLKLLREMLDADLGQDA
jgi:hydrogenase expression/formation protein HypC